MTIFQAILIGIIQGLTEFLPVSSSGHLVISTALYKFFTGSALPLGNPEEIFFDIMVHLATVVAIFIYFWPELSAIFSPKNMIDHLKLYKIRSIKTIKTDIIENYNNYSFNNRMLFLIGMGTLATVCIAFPIKDIAEYLTKSPFVVCFLLLVTGFLLFISHILSEKNQHKTSKITFKRAILIGLSQGFAVLPGISRSGTTIATGLMTGLDRLTAARYSFILSSPIIILAGGYEAIKFFKDGHLTGFNWLAIAIGTLAAGLVGYFCIKYFIQFISKYSLMGFAYYCWAAGILMAVFFYFNPVV